MWTYEQKTGNLLLDGQRTATGYSGRLAGRNNPEMQHVPNTGPIPRGSYKIGPLLEKYPGKGPYVMTLTPVGHDCCGRSGFLIHGDNAKHDASHGCIILERAARLLIGNSGDRDLEVV